MPRKRTTKKAKESVAKTGTVNCGFLNVRKDPKPTGKLLKIIKQGTVVTINEAFEDKEWYKIEEGYVKKAFIDESVD